MSGDNHITEAVFEFLENSGELPAEADRNPQSRFAFQTAIARQTYKKSREATKEANNAIRIANATSADLHVYKKIIGAKMDALVDKIDVRLGLIGGIIIVANVILFLIVKLWP